MRWLGLGLALGMGLANAAWAQNSARFDGQYVGELTLTRVINGDCTEPPLAAIYPLTISGGEVRFSYVPRFDTALRGTVDAKGNFNASARAHSGTIHMTGQVHGDTVIATITSPSCNYSFRTR